MKHVLRLASRYLLYYRARTLILVACIALTFLFPLAVNWLVDSYRNSIGARAKATPLVLGAKGSRYDLVLSTLYYRGRVPAPLPAGEADRCAAGGLALPIPILARHRAAGLPVVGTNPDYYRFRKLHVAAGGFPLLLGECVLGSRAARETGLGPGDTLLTETESVYDISKGYPLRMHVAGVLDETGTPDDRAIFVDVKTAWILEGIGHGHADASKQSDKRILRKTDDRIVLDNSVRRFHEVTPENIDTFHFHVPRADRPLTGVIVVPVSAKASTLLKGRYRVSRTAQLLVPEEVVGEIFGFVFRLKTFFDAHVIVVATATALFLALVILLSVRVRQREMETLHKIGCARSMVVRVMATELAIVLVAGLLVSAGLAAVFVQVVQRAY